MRGQSAEGRLFVLPHAAAIAEDIGAEYGGELTFQYPPIATRLLLQARLVQVGMDAFSICFILVNHTPQHELLYREVGKEPHNLRCFRACLWLTPSFNIVDPQKILETRKGRI